MASATAAPVVTRFAPSPTGRLHLGHAYSALVAWETARRAGGRFLLRIEDIDPTRCRTEHERAILDDLAWLGIDWDGPVRHQSEHMEDYRAALNRLRDEGLVYPCFCTRRQIADEIARAGQAPQGPDGPRYPGTCRVLSASLREARIAAGEPYAWRLDVERALALTGPLVWTDLAQGSVAAEPGRFGDVVLARKETPTSYHLAVTVDDAIQGVTLVTRGADLFEATHIHRLLQALLGLPVPQYRHHRLIVDGEGVRLAKRAGAPTLAAWRAGGHSPASLREMVGLTHDGVV